jgi:hypothetical protein
MHRTGRAVLGSRWIRYFRLPRQPILRLSYRFLSEEVFRNVLRWSLVLTKGLVKCVRCTRVYWLRARLPDFCELQGSMIDNPWHLPALIAYR